VKKKKMNTKKTIAFFAIAAAVAFVASVGLGVSAVCAGTWVTNPGTEASVTGDTITLGIANDVELGHQPEAVHGATLELPPADEIYVEFDYDLSTWDSYNPYNPDAVFGTGYFDSFSISVSQDKYWALALTDPIGGYPLSLGWIWGGTFYGDGILDTTSGSAAVTMTASTTLPNYLNVVLDTATPPANNGNYPSWGTFEITGGEIVGMPFVTKELVEALEDPATSNMDGNIDLGEKWYFNLSITVTNNFDFPIGNVVDYRQDR
jgi:hypothetical protein